MGVDPMKATAHSAMTRPRIDGAASSWSVELPVDMNVMAANPVTAMATKAIASDGASATHSIATPNPVPDTVIVRSPGRPRAAVMRPPKTAPKPMAAVRNP